MVGWSSFPCGTSYSIYSLVEFLYSLADQACPPLNAGSDGINGTTATARTAGDVFGRITTNINPANYSFSAKDEQQPFNRDRFEFNPNVTESFELTNNQRNEPRKSNEINSYFSEAFLPTTMIKKHSSHNVSSAINSEPINLFKDYNASLASQVTGAYMNNANLDNSIFTPDEIIQPIIVFTLSPHLVNFPSKIKHLHSPNKKHLIIHHHY